MTSHDDVHGASLDTPSSVAAQVLIDTDHFDEDFALLTAELGFVVDAIWPADAPRAAVLSGHGVTIRLVGAQRATPVTVMLVRAAAEAPLDPDDSLQPGQLHRLPGGSRLIVEVDPTGYELPDAEPALFVSSADGDSGAGRAGMRYRDLLPNRWGGRFIASLISIPDGGEVPDYVHYHRVRFQLIFVKSGWVKVVYEDQGDPFVMQTGDAVLQVPEIRHRVLEASPGLEVVEITSPAEHITLADHDLVLPNGVGDPSRRWDGQRFVHHRATDATYGPWELVGWEVRDTGIGSATNGLASVRIARPQLGAAASVANSAGGNSDDGDSSQALTHRGEFRQIVVLTGQVTARLADGQRRLQAGASMALPAEQVCTLSEPTSDCELLDIALPAH